jgi:hypothetical protein
MSLTGEEKKLSLICPISAVAQTQRKTLLVFFRRLYFSIGHPYPILSGNLINFFAGRGDASTALFTLDEL